jgi:hypothetical protein
MNIFAMRMEGPYARLLNRLMLRFQVTHIDAELQKVGTMLRENKADLLVTGYAASTFRSGGTFELLHYLAGDPLLAVLPVAVGVSAGQGSAYDEELRLAPAWAGRVLPIDASDFTSPYLEGFLKAHVARFSPAVSAVLDSDLPTAEEPDRIDFPWECP